MSLDKVKKYFKKYQKEKDIIELEESSATVLEAARALHTTEGSIAKTLSFLVNGKPILIVVEGTKKISNSSFKTYFQKKAHMIPFQEVEKYIGHAPGGVCPFAINDDVVVYLDESLRAHDYVYPACGSSNSAIKLTIKELEKYSNYKEWIDVCKKGQ